MSEEGTAMIPVTNVSDKRFQIALSQVCVVCGARRGELCGEDEGVHGERYLEALEAKLRATEEELEWVIRENLGISPERFVVRAIQHSRDRIAAAVARDGDQDARRL